MDECHGTDKMELGALDVFNNVSVYVAFSLLTETPCKIGTEVEKYNQISPSFQDDGTMDQDVDGDGAINLSTSQRPSAATTPNDGVQVDDFHQVSFQLQLKILKQFYLFSFIS